MFGDRLLSDLRHLREESNTGRKIICDEGADFVTDSSSITKIVTLEISHNVGYTLEMKKYSTLEERLSFCQDICTETSKIAGICRGLKELSESTTDPTARYYFKSMLEAQFKLLMINLNIMTLDSYSEIKIDFLIKDFEMKHAGRLKELGLDLEIKKEEAYRIELSHSIETWNDVRGNHAAHRKLNADEKWIVDIDNITIFLYVIRNILNTMTRTIATPSSFPKQSNSLSYTAKAAVDLEEESYNEIKNNLMWRENL